MKGLEAGVKRPDITSKKVGGKRIHNNYIGEISIVTGGKGGIGGGVVKDLLKQKSKVIIFDVAKEPGKFEEEVELFTGAFTKRARLEKKHIEIITADEVKEMPFKMEVNPKKNNAPTGDPEAWAPSKVGPIKQEKETKLTAMEVNVTDMVQVNQAMGEILRRYGKLHNVFNIAGNNGDASIERMTGEKFWKIMKVHVGGTFNLMKQSWSTFIEQHYGNIVNTSSVVKGGREYQIAYSAAKASIESMTETGSREGSKYGIRVNAIRPGFIVTDMTKNIQGDALDKVLNAIPDHKMGTVKQIAKIYTIVGKAELMNGSVVSADKGFRF